MQATAIQKQPPVAEKPVAKAKTSPAARPISWREFQNRYLSREDRFKYEWVGGMVEKTPRTMDQRQFFILRNLLLCFQKLLRSGKVHGQLIPEGDVFFRENHRRPDVLWMTDRQIAEASWDKNPVPAFVIEIVSMNDKSNRIEKKMGDYRRSGVEVVWLIHPEFQTVHVYSGEGLRRMLVCSGEELCSAAPALPGFELSAAAIFEKPPID